MAFASTQVVKIVVSLDRAAAQRELGEAADKARAKAGERTRGPNAGGPGRGGVRPGRLSRLSVSGRSSGRLVGKLARAGLGKFAARALGVSRGGLIGNVIQGVGARIGGRALGGAAAGISVAVIGAAVKLYIDQKYPEFVELARQKSGIDKLLAILSGASRSAQDFKALSENFAILGKDIPGGANRFAERLRQMAVGDELLNNEKEKARRKAMSDLMKDKDFSEYVKRKVLGTAFGQGAASLPDLRAWFLEQFGMRA